jgi:hypothetical protein
MILKSVSFLHWKLDSDHALRACMVEILTCLQFLSKPCIDSFLFSLLVKFLVFREQNEVMNPINIFVLIHF